MMDFLNYNMQVWDQYVERKNRWTVPVTRKEIEDARIGIWGIVLTPTKTVPRNWFPNLRGIRILGLACGGGQQGPILAALGAEVTILDISVKQLYHDIKVNKQFDLKMKTVKGDMRNLSLFTDNYFDLIFNPCSVSFIDDVRQVWRECFRVLKPNGVLMAGFTNPIAFQLSEENGFLRMTYEQPYSDILSLSKMELNEKKQKYETLEFGHSFTDLIGGQLEAGFHLTDMYEDDWNSTKLLDRYLPSFIAVRSIKINREDIKKL